MTVRKVVVYYDSGTSGGLSVDTLGPASVVTTSDGWYEVHEKGTRVTRYPVHNIVKVEETELCHGGDGSWCLSWERCCSA